MNRLLRLLALYRPFYGWMALGILASLVTLLANVTLLAVSGWFITSMALAGVAQTSMNYFTPAAIIRAAAILRTGGRYVERLVTHEATLRLLAILRAWFYERLEPLAPAVLQHHHSGDLLSRIRADIDTLDNLYLRLLVPGITALLGGLILSLFLASYDRRFGALLLVALLASGLLLPWLAFHLGRDPGRRKLQLLAAQRELLVDSMQGMGELLQFGVADRYIESVHANSLELQAQQRSLARTDGLSQGGLLWLAHLTLWLLLWLAIPLVEQGSLPSADLAMLALFSLAAFEAVAPMSLALKAYGETELAAQRLFEIVDAEPQVVDPLTVSPQPGDNGLRFEQVTFTYPGGIRPVLSDFDLQLPAGERLTVVGPSGAGKSTLVQLLLRFYDPNRGRILLGGRPLSEFRGEDLRRCFAVVSQQTHLFTGTLRDNLLLGNQQASQQQLEQACRVARIHERILALPDGYDTWVGEAGATLSGGEARRIAIARAVLKNAPILILDEPAEGLDPTTAAEVMQALDRIAEGKTVLMITHRPGQSAGFGPQLRLGN